MEPAETPPEQPSPADIRRLAERLLRTRQDFIDEMTPQAKAALDAALPGPDEKYRQSVNRP